jgi:hypothetical protein
MTICNVFGICCSSKKVLCSFTPQHLHLPWYGVPTCKITLLSIMCSDMLNCLSFLLSAIVFSVLFRNSASAFTSEILKWKTNVFLKSHVNHELFSLKTMSLFKSLKIRFLKNIDYKSAVDYKLSYLKTWTLFKYPTCKTRTTLDVNSLLDLELYNIKILTRISLMY